METNDIRLHFENIALDPEFSGCPFRRDGRFDARTSPGWCRLSSTFAGVVHLDRE